MRKLQTILRNINPIRNHENNSSIEYVVQKLLAFILIYVISSVLIEALIIIVFAALGYDVLHGVMPDSEIVSLIPLYGFLGFGVITVLYVTKIEKRYLQTMKRIKVTVCVKTNKCAERKSVWLHLSLVSNIVNFIYCPKSQVAGVDFFGSFIRKLHADT